MTSSAIRSLIGCVSVSWFGLAAAHAAPVQARIEKTADGFRLLRGGQPIHLNGAAVDDATALPNVPPGVPSRVALLAQAGANAARLASNRRILDEAHANGLVGIVDLILDGERDGMDWSNDRQVAEQDARALAIVRELKDHPAIVAWVLGNEIDYIPPNEPYNPRIWSRLNDLAKAIKEIDPHHLTLTIIGDSYFEAKVRELARDGTHIDLLGINAYGALEKNTAIVRQLWPKPYLVTEWGPTGHWEVPRTTWGAPIEQTSSEKAVATDERYNQIILRDRTHCLGSFIFYWSQKQETTHTWYGLFSEQLRTQAIDVMQRNWSGRKPENLAPTVVALEVAGTPDKRSLILLPGSEHAARVAVLDAEGDALTYTWDVRPEVVIPPGNYAGRKEKPAPILAGQMLSNGSPRVTFKAPEAEGPYRLFVSIRDGQGSIAYANFPFYVSKTGKFERLRDRHL